MKKNRFTICGIDEAGRGALAGPVVASAVVFPKSYRNEAIRDSKKLTPKAREELAEIIKAKAIDWAIGIATAEEITRLNILRASLLAMERAFEKLTCVADEIIVDGIYRPNIVIQNKTILRAIPQADEKVLAVSAASILAKVERDRMMKELQWEHFNFEFNRHKGYPTKKHLMELARFGPTKAHRLTFKPVSALMIQIGSSEGSDEEVY